MTFRCVFLASLLAAAGLSPAQEAAREARFLPLGDLPPYRQEIRDGVAYELDPPPGSIPPRELVAGAGEDAVETPLSLGRASAPLKVPQGAGPLALYRKGEGGEAEPWLRIERPEAGDFLVVLWRSAEKKSWEVPRALVIPDGPEDAPAGSVRVVNVSPVTVMIVFEGSKIALPAGQVWKKPVTSGKDAVIQIGAVDAAGNLRRIHAGSVFQNPGERTLVAVYRADGVDPRRPLKAVIQREPVDPARR